MSCEEIALGILAPRWPSARQYTDAGFATASQPDHCLTFAAPQISYFPARKWQCSWTDATGMAAQSIMSLRYRTNSTGSQRSIKIAHETLTRMRGSWLTAGYQYVSGLTRIQSKQQIL
jgi:hypothetical protein